MARTFSPFGPLLTTPAFRAVATAPAFYAAVLAAAVAASPPSAMAQDTPPLESGNFRRPELVELIHFDPRLVLEIRYATPHNFVGRAVYAEKRAFLQRPAAEALMRAHDKLRRQGYGLLIFDGYRPWSVTKMFWDLTPQHKRDFVANPRKGSRHNRGCAVDLTLIDLATSLPVQMPSDYDEFSERAYPHYGGGTPESRRLRDLLRSTMESEGFSVNANEWWHFDYKDWRHYPILNVEFSQIGYHAAVPAR